MNVPPKNLIHPARLAEGARIGLAAPASPFDESRLARGRAALAAMGFKVVAEDDIFLKKGYLAGSAAQRAAHLQRLFADPKIDAVMCVRGGYGSMGLLDKLDYALIRSNPKILLGFSDISVLLAVIYDRCELVGFHGPTVSALAEADQATLAGLKKALCSDTPPAFDLPAAGVLCPGVATGPVAGGNLSVLNHLLGTGYLPDYKNHIVVLEDQAEALYRIDRMLTQMDLSGVFKGVAGLVLGQFTDCGPTSEVRRIFTEKFAGAGIPVAAGLAAGHGATNLTFPIGETATLDTAAGRLAYYRAPTAKRS